MAAASALLGGLGLFLLGTWLMTEGLKQAAGAALRDILERWTNTPLRGLLAGMLVTALVRSSSAVTVAAVGFVNAGLLTLTQAVWVVFGTNVGTTTTAWLVAFAGIGIDIAAYAMPLLGIGMGLRLFAAQRVRLAGIGQALAGFGAFFLGIEVLQQGFAGLAPRLAGLDLPEGGLLAILGFVLLGTALTLLTQASSAAIAIVLTATAGGAVPLDLAAAAVIGTNIGTTSTALLAAIGATAPARRVAAAHIVFNLMTGAVALVLLAPLVAGSRWIAGAVGAGQDMPTVLAVFHTVFNLLGVALIWPFARRLIAWLSRRFARAEDALGRARHLDETLMPVPDLAVRAVGREVARMMAIAASIAAPGGGGQAEAEARARAVASLGREIRAFVARLHAQPLPEAVVHALPNLLRAVQHAEVVAAEAARLWEADAAARHAGGADLALLESAMGEALRSGDPDAAMAAAAGAEAAYQAVKQRLLAAAAEGTVPVATMDAALLHAQRLRHIAAGIAKGRRRLAAARSGEAFEEDAAGNGRAAVQ
ncbi:Na/Pi cotransporter family protein [Roseomonas alkaliterrae]|uniref:Phosphate:Na+ symporter n=1 Tax=Neoroseomonas alkaliterrae TaxID=1452450 RepID=A0A840XZE1_9PROT|nr:phosphate:Na+ symporter [Neoroseomonas alkaliterrae]MBR0675378.1 Na/Pi cotransporter family protein [Neoroseomonas alkaliterrae]